MYGKYRKAVSINGIRILCKSCNRTTCRYPPGIELWQRLLPEAIQHLALQKMFKKCGYRDVGREDYAMPGFSAATCWKVIQELGPKAKEAMSDLSKGWSSTLIVDEKYEKCKSGTIMWIVAGQFFRDTNGHHYCCIIKTKTFYIQAKEESRKDKRKLKKDVRELLAKQNPVFFQELADEMDDPENIKAIVTDLENTYPDAIAKAFPNARHQFCLQHVVESLKRIFDKEIGRKNMTDEDQKILDALYSLPNIQSESEYFELRDRFQIWWSKSKDRIHPKPNQYGTNTGIEWWYNHVLAKKENICAFLEVDGSPPTTNSLESQFARVKPRTLLMKSFQSGSGATNYLNLMAVYLNVAPFSDGHNKGLSIVDLAGIDWKQELFPSAST